MAALQQEKTATARLIQRVRGFRYALIWEGIAVGIAAGVVTALFRLLLERGDAFRQAVGAFLVGNLWFLPLWLLILVAVAGVVTLLLRWEPYIGGSGIPQVEGELQGALSQTWWRVLLAKFVGGLLTITSGLSLGREGPSIQLGAMAGKGVSRLCRREGTEEKMLLTCGASAGLSAAFNAPLAGVLFSLEELHKDFSTDVLLSTMSALHHRGLCFPHPLRPGSRVRLSRPGRAAPVPVLDGDALSQSYNFCVEKVQALYSKIPWQFVRALIPFLLAGVLLLVYPSVLGGGNHLVGAVSQEVALESLLLLFVLKFTFSMLSFGSGVPGGIFLPLLVLGAVVGSTFCQGLHLLGVEAATANFVILGMAGLFSAIVRAPVTGIILISEMTGSLSQLLTLSLVSLAAYLVADLLHSKPVYDLLLERLLKKGGQGSAGAFRGEAAAPGNCVPRGAGVRQGRAGYPLARPFSHRFGEAPSAGAGSPWGHRAPARGRDRVAVRRRGEPFRPCRIGIPVQKLSARGRLWTGRGECGKIIKICLRKTRKVPPWLPQTGGVQPLLGGPFPSSLETEDVL